MGRLIPFHKISDERWEELKAQGITWGELGKLHPAPKWCEYPGATEGVMGCWSLTGRHIKSKRDCHGCELCRSTAKHHLRELEKNMEVLRASAESRP